LLVPTGLYEKASGSEDQFHYQHLSIAISLSFSLFSHDPAPLLLDFSVALSMG
jgi:hypothetical protein